MSNYKLTFKLKQHTPIIHFQYDQTGATLRATELKPKLDRFILEKLGNGDYEAGTQEAKNRGWLIGDGEHPALDYKVRVNSENIKINNQVIKSNDRIPNFFANMGKEFKQNPKGKSYTNSNLTLTISIITFNEKLKEYICQNLPEFFAHTNFGTRQNKGFGSFYLDEKNNCYKPINEVLSEFPFLEFNSNNLNIILKVIEYYYKRLKAGINNNFNKLCASNPNCDPKKYKKSYLFKFFNDKTKKGWEKRWIKETFFGLNNDGVEKFFIRALLGLPGSYSFRPTNEPCHKKNDKKIDKNYKILDEYEIEVTHSIIERFKSPITFKPIIENEKTYIYIIPNKSYELLLNKNKTPFIFYKKFIIKNMYKDNNRIVISPNKPIPSLNGTKKKEIDDITSKIDKQEELANTYIQEINSLLSNTQNDRKLKNLKCQIEKLIIGQTQRFKVFLGECTSKDDKYYPPNAEIFLPETIDIFDLIKEYNRNELLNDFMVEINRNQKIKVVIK